MWCIGLSGSGKTTLASVIIERVRTRLSNVVLVDGDLMREIWGDIGHSLAERKMNADRLCRLSRYFETQNIHAVCAVLSLFEESRAWNREHLQSYYEVYIRTPLPDLVRRDGKGLYARAEKGEIQLPGVNMTFSEPIRPDETIDNSGSLQELLSHASRLDALFR